MDMYRQTETDPACVSMQGQPCAASCTHSRTTTTDTMQHQVVVCGAPDCATAGYPATGRAQPPPARGVSLLAAFRAMRRHTDTPSSCAASACAWRLGCLSHHVQRHPRQFTRRPARAGRAGATTRRGRSCASPARAPRREMPSSALSVSFFEYATPDCLAFTPSPPGAASKPWDLRSP